MSDAEIHAVIDAVRRALGRTGPLAEKPAPPAIDEPLVRLVHTDLGLAELFAKNASDSAMDVEMVYVDELHGRLIAFLQSRHCRRVALPVSDFLEKLGVLEALKQAGLEARRWDEMTLDELFDFDAGVTDVYCAVAETGSLVIRPTPGHGRALSLAPPIHVAILQPRDFVPDLVDLFEKLGGEGVGSNVTMITGPSKTADIEMNVVTGVHGPMQVKLFVLQ